VTIANDSRAYYDPHDAGISADPFPTYRRLRDETPVYYNEPYDVWALSRHADVERGLVDWETFSNSRSDILEIIKSARQ
jgi:cytochrome P450